MPSSPPEEQISKLLEDRKRLDARIARLNARVTSQKRKMDTRRKIVVGAVILKEAEQKPELATWLNGLLNARLVATRDRDMFDLSIPSSPPAAVAANDTSQPKEAA